MEKIKIPWRRRLSLKGALVFTTVVCLLLGFSMCMLELYTISTVHRDIYETYVRPYYPDGIELEDGSFQFQVVSPNGSVSILSGDSPRYVDPETGEVYPSDTPSYFFIPAGFFQFIYRHTETISILLCFATAVLFFALDAAWFYRWKIK